MRPRFAALAVGAASALVVLTLIVMTHPFLPVDAAVERDVQATDWGPLAYTFPFFTWIGDFKGAIVDGIVFVLVLLFNRRAWVAAAWCAATAAWYVILSHVFFRPRPVVPEVLRVTEHPGASSFPSGHTIFIATIVTILMLCLGQRFLPAWARPVGWALAALTVIACAISRVDTGAHWPTDVLAAILVAVAWLAFVVAVRPISDGALQPEKQPT